MSIKDEIRKINKQARSIWFTTRELEKELDTLSKPSVPSVETLLTIVKEIRENNCLACELRFSRTDCILAQVKNGNKCPKEITDEDIVQAIHNLITKGL